VTLLCPLVVSFVAPLRLAFLPHSFETAGFLPAHKARSDAQSGVVEICITSANVAVVVLHAKENERGGNTTQPSLSKFSCETVKGQGRTLPCARDTPSPSDGAATFQVKTRI